MDTLTEKQAQVVKGFARDVVLTGHKDRNKNIKLLGRCMSHYYCTVFAGPNARIVRCARGLALLPELKLVTLPFQSVVSGTLREGN